MTGNGDGNWFQFINFLRLNLEIILVYLTVLFGCIVAQVFAVWKSFAGTRDFIKQVAPTLEESVVARADFILVSILGSILGILLFSPVDYRQALFAGIGWVATIQALSQGREAPVLAGPGEPAPPETTVPVEDPSLPPADSAPHRSA